MQHGFHGEEGDQEADAVEGGSGTGDAFGGIAGLGDVIVEGEDGAREVERGVESVGKVVAEAVLVRFGGYVDSISFRQGGGVQLLLLDNVSSRFTRFSGYSVPPEHYRWIDWSSSSSRG